MRECEDLIEAGLQGKETDLKRALQLIAEYPTAGQHTPNRARASFIT